MLTRVWHQGLSVLLVTHGAVIEVNIFTNWFFFPREKESVREKTHGAVTGWRRLVTHGAVTGWRRLIGSRKVQIIFHKRATKYRSLLRWMTCKDKGSYETSPPCIEVNIKRREKESVREKNTKLVGKGWRAKGFNALWRGDCGPGKMHWRENRFMRLEQKKIDLWD